jgi:hypothetical protein
MFDTLVMSGERWGSALNLQSHSYIAARYVVNNKPKLFYAQVDFYFTHLFEGKLHRFAKVRWYSTFEQAKNYLYFLRSSNPDSDPEKDAPYMPEWQLALPPVGPESKDDLEEFDFSADWKSKLEKSYTRRLKKADPVMLGQSTSVEWLKAVGCLIDYHLPLCRATVEEEAYPLLNPQPDGPDIDDIVPVHRFACRWLPCRRAPLATLQEACATNTTAALEPVWLQAMPLPVKAHV